MKKSFYAQSFQELTHFFKDNGLNTCAATILYNCHYKKRRTEVCPENIARESRELLDSKFYFDLPKVDTVYEAKDGTVKFLFKLSDGRKVETVLIPFHNKYSICLSSQVGCAMKCSFCFTGTQGLMRNLKTDEIVGQYLQAWRWLEKNRAGDPRILNIVYMGQGEPLHNFEQVKKSCEIFLSSHGTSIGSQKITISTSGFIPGLKRWNDEMPGVNLALSLHSPYDEKRSELIPINKKYPIEQVLQFIDEIPLQKKQFITYEYLLIDDFNDSPDDAHKTGELLTGKRAYINLIPFNPFPGSKYQRPSEQKVENFKQVLDTYKIPTLIRGTKGDDVLAACGQLNSAQ